MIEIKFRKKAYTGHYNLRQENVKRLKRALFIRMGLLLLFGIEIAKGSLYEEMNFMETRRKKIDSQLIMSLGDDASLETDEFIAGLGTLYQWTPFNNDLLSQVP